ncbi:Putative exosome-associated factor Rrp47/DNA strand repair C1D [Septoria linicola]|uniref:Exosome complex protein n=1 Tax=Septoria linicola TaxID=215465 RepID=A0A9Q9AKA6_9PEZI|nr:putative exosome-associated factor Rrp47/DNA strand repair C1D [Septoria linicola]USW50962.1 Putative exosome-associated factor Rrp47/DNA strand repair C1D [Septoria linicola]
MESIQPQIEDLITNIDDLEAALGPIIKTALGTTTSKLPLLDKAKLYVLATYAIESILFSYLRLNGVDAKSHPVFQELTRVKEYFNKIGTAETAGVGSKNRIDKDAAGRFIKAGLSGNDKYDADRKERQEREKAGAKRKLENMSTGTHTRFDGAAKRTKAQEGETIRVVKASEVEDSEGTGKESKEGTPMPTRPKKGKKRKSNKG